MEEIKGGGLEVEGTLGRVKDGEQEVEGKKWREEKKVGLKG